MPPLRSALTTTATEPETGPAGVADFRYAPVPLIMFVAGWLLLAWVAVRLLRDPAGTATARIGRSVTALCLLLFVPQFFAPGPVRIVHGIMLGIGLMVWAAGTRQVTRRAGVTNRTDTRSGPGDTLRTRGHAQNGGQGIGR